MTDPATKDQATVEKARRLLNLYLGAQGGERDKAAGALRALLQRQDLTLFDLDPGYPVTQDPAQLQDWRASQGWLARLNGPDQDAALNALVDASDLTPEERRRVLDGLSILALVNTRAPGWAVGTDDLTPEDLTRAAGRLREAEVLAEPAPSLSEAVRTLVTRTAWQDTHPSRSLRAENRQDAAFVAGVIEGVTGRSATYSDTAAEAPLSADQLSRVRAIVHQGRAAVTAELEREARRLGARLGRG